MIYFVQVEEIGMRLLMVAILVQLVAAGCVTKPEPWTPGGSDTQKSDDLTEAETETVEEVSVPGEDAEVPDGSTGVDLAPLETAVEDEGVAQPEHGAVKFDGTDQHLPDGGITGPRTFSLWFKASQLLGTQTLLVKKGEPGTGNARPVHIQLEETLLQAFVTPSLKTDQLVGSTTVVAQEWIHVVLQASDDQAAFFVDGEQIGVVQLPGTSIDNDSGYTVGALPKVTEYGEPFLGSIFNLRIRAGFQFEDGFDPCADDAVDPEGGSHYIDGEEAPPCQD